MDKAREDNFSQDLNAVMEYITTEQWSEIQINGMKVL